MAKAPYRVGAVLSSNEEHINFLGWGEYVGDEVPPADTDPESFLQMLHDNGIPNPKIVLDNGSVVWGCQCWWGPEQKMLEWIDSRKLVIVDVDGNPLLGAAEQTV